MNRARYSDNISYTETQNRMLSNDASPFNNFKIKN